MEEKTTKPTATQVVKEIRRNTRRKFSAEEKIRIVLEVLRGEDTIAAICRNQRQNGGKRGGGTAWYLHPVIPPERS